MKALVTGLVCLLLPATVIAQSNSQPVLQPRTNAPVQDLPTPGADTKVAPDAPVITIQGLCDNPAAATDCKTVITREQFEKAASVAQPNMPKPQEKMFATRYVTALLLAQKARELGLDKGPQYDLMHLQLLAQLAVTNLQKEAAKVSDQEIENYYKQHQDEYRTVSYDKLFVEKMKKADQSLKPSDPDYLQKRQASEAAMKDEAEKLRTRAAAGEDFVKLQQAAYDFAGDNLKAAETRVDNVAKTRMLPADAVIFQLKPGEVSQAINDPQAFMIYKVISFQNQPLADVREQVSREVQSQKLNALGQELQKSATDKAKYDDAYFAVPPAPSLRTPGEPAPPSAQTTPGNK